MQGLSSEGKEQGTDDRLSPPEDVRDNVAQSSEEESRLNGCTSHSLSS